MLGQNAGLWVGGCVFLMTLAMISIAGIWHLHRRDVPKGGRSFADELRRITPALIVVGASVFLFVAIADGWLGQAWVYEIDIRINEYFQHNEFTWLTDILHVITWFGSTQAAIATLLIVGFYLWHDRLYERLAILIVTFLPDSAANWALKALFDRARPEDPLAPTVGQSFPSGHAFSVTIICGFLIFLTWLDERSVWLRIVLTILLMLIIVAVAASRIVLNVHWTSDVLGGVAFGVAWLVGSILISSIAARVVRQ